MNDPAINIDSVKTGVTNDERFEVLSQEIHGFGARHDVATCSDLSCGHPGHGLSTAGKSLEGNLRAGDVNQESIGVRIVHTPDGQERAELSSQGYRPEIARGGDGAIEAMDHNPETCEIARCASCNKIAERDLQPDYAIRRGGGGSSGRTRKSNRPLTGPERIERRLMGSTPFDERGREDEMRRAQRMMREAQNRPPSTPGPKPKGRETRMRVNGRLEPSVVERINRVSGSSTIAFVEQMDNLLVEAAKSEAGRETLLRKFDEWIEGIQGVA